MSDYDRLREAIKWARSGFRDSADIELILAAAESTLPKTKVETAYYVTIDPPEGRIIRLRFTSDRAVFKRIQCDLQDGARVTIDRPRQEEVPA